MLSSAATAVLSPAQEVLALAERMRPGTVLDPRCVVWRAYALPAAPDLELLGAALSAVLARHDALRTVPVATGNGLAGLVHPPAPAAVGVGALDPGEDDVRPAVQAAAGAPYDLEAGPLARLTWLSRGAAGVLVVSAHHWAADAAALDALQTDLAACYAALSAGSALPPSPTSYAAVAREQQAAAGAPDVDVDDAVGWWREQLVGARRGALPVLAAEGTRSGTTALVSTRFAPETSAALLALAGRLRASPYMVVLGALTAVLEDGRAERDRDLLVFGTDPSRTRRTRGVVGFLTEPLPLRLVVSLDAPLAGAVEQARASVLGALAHRQVPFLRLLEAAPRLAVPLLTGRRPMTLVQHVTVPPLRLAGLVGTPLPTFEAVTSGEWHPSTLPLDLDLTVEQIGSGHSAGVLHDPGLWTTSEVQGALTTLEQVLQSAAQDERLPLGAQVR